MANIYEHITQIINNRETAVICTVVRTQGSTPLKTGAKLIIWEDGKTFGTIGGGALEYAVLKEASGVMINETPHTFTHNLIKDHAMCCGGTVEVLIEPISLPHRLLVFGAGHIGSALAEFATQLDFEVTLVDQRNELLVGMMAKEIPVINSSPRDVFGILDSFFDPKTFVIIATHLHVLDREVLAWAITKPFGYIGMIGSQRKAIVTRKLFMEKGLATSRQLDQVDIPMGIAINAESPREIAVSILGRLIQVKNQKKCKERSLDSSRFAQEFSTEGIPTTEGIPNCLINSDKL